MKHRKIIIALLASTLLSCHGKNEWQNMRVDGSLTCSDMSTECTLDEGQRWQKCHVYTDNDTLYLVFVALPAYCEDVTVKIHDGKFLAAACAIPFEPLEISYTTRQQHLQLNRTHYSTGDTLCGVCRFAFDFTSKPLFGDEKEIRGSSIFQGSICEIVREKDFDPFEEKNFMTFHLSAALLELGEPLYRDTFSTDGLPEFRVELLNHFPASENIRIEELTWDASETRTVSDEGEERLTIWYDSAGKPVAFVQWNKNTQF
ncbi:MAG: hypothetical protein LBT48_04885 [Prevotellaceae bacterium]|jgi:hypothetical protein|nr:hypothetical protein [Prevotellaceae bacterium]